MSHRAFLDDELLKTKFGFALILRKKSREQFEAGTFLVDMHCLGIKNAFYTDSRLFASVDHLLEKFFQGREYTEVAPPYARKLVEKSVDYARNIGFEPHRHYKKAARVMGGIRPEECAEEFEFGHEGKPMYVQGPDDSPEMVARVMNLLRARCGEGNYHFVIKAPD